MFCDKCGKSNAKDVEKCAYCGCEMPKTADSSGFSDILTFTASEPIDSVAGYGTVTGVGNGVGKVSEVEMKKLLEKSENIFKNTRLSLIAIVISILILLFSLYMNAVLRSQLDEISEKLEKIESAKATEVVVVEEDQPTEMDVNGASMPSVEALAFHYKILLTGIN